MGTLKKLRKMVVIEDKKDNLINTNVFCTSLDLARITGKEHFHILRDIEDTYKQLVELEKNGTISNFVPKYITEDDKMFEDTERVFKSENAQNSSGTALTFGGTSENQGEIPEKVVIQEYYPKLLRNFRVVRSQYITSQNKTAPMFALDEVMYLCMMNRYDDIIRYYMAKYYVERTKELAKDPNHLALLSIDQLEDAKDIIKSNKKPKKKGAIAIGTMDGYFGTESWLKTNWNIYRMEEMERILKTFNVRSEKMNSLIFEESYSNSLIVSETTEKLHYNVIRDVKSIIENLSKKDVSNEEITNHFKESSYTDASGKSNPMISLDKIGFITLLGRYRTEVNYLLAEFYVYNTATHIEYEDLVNINIAAINKAINLKKNKKYLDDDNVYLTPNMTYKPRLMKKEKGYITNGSIAILIPKFDFNLTKEQMKYISTEEFRKFYQIARNYQTRSLNVDKSSSYWFGIYSLDK